MKDLYCIMKRSGDISTMCIFNYRKIRSSSVPSDFNWERLSSIVFSVGHGLLIPRSGHGQQITVDSNFEEVCSNGNVYKVDSLYIKTSRYRSSDRLYCRNHMVGNYNSFYSRHVNIPISKDTFISEVYIRAKQVPFQLLKEKLMQL